MRMQQYIPLLLLFSTRLLTVENEDVEDKMSDDLEDNMDDNDGDIILQMMLLLKVL